MRNLSILVITLVIIFSLMSPATAGKAAPNKPAYAWYLVFEFVDEWGLPLMDEYGNDVRCTTVIGGTDREQGVGISTQFQDYTGLHMGVGDQGLAWWDVVAGSQTKVLKNLYVWSNDQRISVAFVHWYTAASYFNENLIFSKTFWPHVLYSLDMVDVQYGDVLDIGDFSKARQGWISTPVVPTAWDGGQMIRVDVNPPRN